MVRVPTHHRDRGINTLLQVHDLACVKMGSSRLDQGIDRSEGDGNRVLTKQKEVSLTRKSILNVEWSDCLVVFCVLLDDVCCCSLRNCYCHDARDRGTGVERDDILATGNVGP